LDATGRRKRAKPFLYAFLFGGSAGKLAIILVGKRDAKLGQKALELFQSSIPGFKELMDELKGEYEAAMSRFGREHAFIRGIDGRIIFIDSPHKILVYLLQTLEAITCKSAAVYLEDRLIEEGIPFEWRIHYHDELAVQVEKKYAKRVAELSVEAFTEAPKWFGVECMGGDAKIGKNYAEIH
jgi:DNA polymerase-1